MNPYNPFTSELELLRASFREFVKHEITPYVEAWEADKHCDIGIFRKMGQQGYFGITYPEAYGGSAMNLWAAVVIAEELAHANCGGLAMSLYAHAYLPLPLINALGTEAQKQAYLKPALAGQKIAALAITEPGAGSDVGGIRTFAEDRGDYFVLNGSKMFITNGTIADFVVVVARTGPDYDMTVLIVDTHTEGFRAIPIKNKLGMHTSDTGQLFFEDCIVPKENMIGDKGAGFYYIMNNIQEERLVAAVMGTASCEHALYKAMQYAKEREAFGRKIGKFQVIRHKMAQMAIVVEACRSITYRAVHEFIEQGPAAIKIVSMAKAFVSEQNFNIINEALQIHGGWGYMEELGVARSLRDARLMTVGAGTTEVMLEIISKLIVDDTRHVRQYFNARG